MQKKKVKWFFHIWLVFVTQGVNSKQCSINIFCLTNKITFKTDQVYSNTRVPTQVNTNQHESTQVNTNQHESNTSQHESKTSQHESNTSQHESTQVKKCTR